CRALLEFPSGGRRIGEDCAVWPRRGTHSAGHYRGPENPSRTHRKQGAEESTGDGACTELKYGTIRHPTTATAVLPMTGGACPQCAISVWSDKLTISKPRSRSRVAINRVTLFGPNALVSRTARMFLPPH